MNRNFAYLFIVGHKIVWSGENLESLYKRIAADDCEEVTRFVSHSKPGDFLETSTGEVILHTRE